MRRGTGCRQRNGQDRGRRQEHRHGGGQCFFAQPTEARRGHDELLARRVARGGSGHYGSAGQSGGACGVDSANGRPTGPAAPAAPNSEAGAQQAPASATSFSQAELEKLLAPIALYPDGLLAQVLAASAYPIQIVQVHRWLDRNADAVARNDYSGIDSTNWDPAVKALARFPDVIKKMSENLDWTTDLGDAFVNQPKDVADVIQALRTRPKMQAI